MSVTTSQSGLAVVEPLESRLMFSAAPSLATDVFDHYWVSGGRGRAIGIDGYDADGDALTITAVSDNPALACTVVGGNRYAVMHYVSASGADLGDIVVQLFEDVAPLACARFITLATQQVVGGAAVAGTPFYTNVPVHRTIDRFMMQTGDAVNKNGTGGSGLGTFNDEFTDALSFFGKGMLAMANSGVNTNDSQFFITDASTTWLNGKHTIFGQMISGFATLDTILDLPTDQNDRPLNPPLLQRVDILESSPQDAVLRIDPDAGFAGTANVTITLDDGQGHQTTKVITVTNATSPSLSATTIQAAVGAAGVVDYTVGGGLPVNLSARSQYLDVEFTVDAVNTRVEFTAPAHVSGVVPIELTALEAPRWDCIAPLTRTVWVPVQNGRVLDDLDWLYTTGLDGVEKAVISGDYLYAACGASGLLVYDISDPENMAFAGSHNTAGNAYDVVVSGDVAFVADFHGGVVALDVSDPADIEVLDTVLPSHTASNMVAYALGLHLSGNNLFVAGYPFGEGDEPTDPDYYRVPGMVFCLDVTTLLNSALADDARVFGDELGRITGQGRGFLIAPFSLARTGNTLYVSDLAGGIVVLNVANPANMVPVNAIGTSGEPWQIQVSGTRLYVADSISGLIAYDLKNPVSPKYIGRNSTLADITKLTVVGSTALVPTADGLAMVDLNDSKLRVDGYFAGPVRFAAQSGNALLLGTTGFGLVSAEAEDLTHRTTIRGKATIVDEAGVAVTITVSNGLAYAYTTGAGAGNITRLEVVGGTTRTSVKITTPKGTTSPLGEVSVEGDIGTFAASTMTVAGDVQVSGSAGTLTLGSTSGEHTIVIGPSSNPKAAVVLTLGVVGDLSIDSAMPLKSLTAQSWADADDDDLISAPWIGTVTSKAGDFNADMALTGVGASRTTLGKVKITGSMRHAAWDITGHLGTLTVSGWVEACVVRTSGDMAGLTLGGVNGADFLAGVRQEGLGETLRRAQLVGDFVADRTIKSIKITGIRGQDKTQDYALDSNFSAAIFGAVSLVNVGGPLDICAKQMNTGKEIKSVSCRTLFDKARWSWTIARPAADTGDVTIDLLA